MAMHLSSVSVIHHNSLTCHGAWLILGEEVTVSNYLWDVYKFSRIRGASMLNYRFREYALFSFLICSLSLVPLGASVSVRNDKVEIPTSTWLESFFSLPPLHRLPRDLRRKLIPLCFCAAVMRDPLQEILPIAEEGALGSLAFGNKGTHLAYAQNEDCTIVNLLTGERLPGGTFHHNHIGGIAFNEDDSLIAFVQSNGLVYTVRVLESYRVASNNGSNNPTLLRREDVPRANKNLAHPCIAFTVQGQLASIKTFNEVMITSSLIIRSEKYVLIGDSKYWSYSDGVHDESEEYLSRGPLLKQDSGGVCW